MNRDSNTDQDPDNQPSKRMGAESSRQSNKNLSHDARQYLDSGLKMTRVAAQMKTALLGEMRAAEFRDGLADGVRGLDAAGREVRGDGRLVGRFIGKLDRKLSTSSG